MVVQKGRSLALVLVDAIVCDLWTFQLRHWLPGPAVLDYLTRAES